MIRPPFGKKSSFSAAGSAAAEIMPLASWTGSVAVRGGGRGACWCSRSAAAADLEGDIKVVLELRDFLWTKDARELDKALRLEVVQLLLSEGKAGHTDGAWVVWRSSAAVFVRRRTLVDKRCSSLSPWLLY